MNLLGNKVMELMQGTDRSKWIVHSNHNIKCFGKGDIEQITNNYRYILGSGGFGEVYEGVLEDKSMVAVKKFIHNVKENFAKELTIHCEINHRNVVRLIGYCIDENALTMVTEYVPNGNLSDVLHHENAPIPLDIRLRIATECAEALAYMHSHMYTQVIHGDIKPANILLDGNFNAKLSDFGISRLVTTDKTLYTENVKGSIGYMDPLFARDGRLTVKSDVYSFGVVLLELITRKKATTGDVSIVSVFTEDVARGVRELREMIDPEIANQNNMIILEEVAKLAIECLRMERDRRPEMIDVAENLRMLQKASHQGQEPVYLFSWTGKCLRAPPAVVSMATNILPSDLCRHFSFEEIKAATNNFDESLLVGEGAFGRVYHGKIDGGATEVAIKHRQPWSKYRAPEFYAEIEVMSKLCHHHLVPLIGHCNEKDELILVYEYMARGSLRKHLYMTQEPPLTWKQRLEICIGAARGLQHLHLLQIIHRNINTSDILLDEDWIAKITGIGLSTTEPSTGETTTFKSSGGLIDPEYFRTFQLTEKSDVYSFGAVLFEVLCAGPVMNCIFPIRVGNVVDWALQCKQEGNIDQIVSPYIKGRINAQCFHKFIETAEKCVADRGIDRPSMEDVLLDLECALELQVSAEVNTS
uniref:Protein kinase domain-containing protein n=2 Tax=Setaria italica TaxID=4555 RepID=K4A6Y2_SETIT